MLARVIGFPCGAIDALPLILAHIGMMRDGMFAVIKIHVLVHPLTFFPQYLVVLRTWERGQNEEFKNIEGQLLLYDRDILADGFWRVGGKS
jgi:hypothetical protein